jgi:aminopeptidase N
MRYAWLAVALWLAACGGGDSSSSADIPRNVDRDIQSTDLAIDVATHEGSADIRVAESSQRGLSLLVGDLTILSVTDGSAALPYAVTDADGIAATVGNRLDIAIGAGKRAVIRYRYSDHESMNGASASGYTFLWPRYCQNLFPCETSPVDGSEFTLTLSGIGNGLQAVYPGHLASAPAYQLAWAIADYRWLDLGTTDGGTHLRAAYFQSDASAAAAGTARLREIFSWYETTLGSYPWGSEAASVEVAWPAGSYGGMEHHPFWHISSRSFGDPLIHAHEAAHGWFGDGVRLACWEDFVLSEGTASYLAAAAIGAVYGANAEQAVWAQYDEALAQQTALANHAAWPDGCSDNFDVLGIFDVIAYYRGANFFRAVEGQVGRPALLSALRQFVAGHRFEAARFGDLLDTIRQQTGYDPQPLVDQYLRNA